jgi:hypothetical protein
MVGKFVQKSQNKVFEGSPEYSIEPRLQKIWDGIRENDARSGDLQPGARLTVPSSFLDRLWRPSPTRLSLCCIQRRTASDLSRPHEKQESKNRVILGDLVQQE